MVKNLPAMQETQVQSLSQEDPVEKVMATHSSILAWEIPGQQSLADYSSWGGKESDTTERRTLSLSCQFKNPIWTSLVVQGIRICLSVQGDTDSIPGLGRSHMPWSN